LETLLLFIDYEKAFDNIQRQILFNILKSRNLGNCGYLHTEQNIDKI
jgi:hypothetical protein